MADEVSVSPYRLPEGNIQISFSGGRTSGYMLHAILAANEGLPERARVVFANTGREMPQTLDFVQECGQRWNVPIVWVEYRPTTPLFEVVGHNSAARDGEPFEALIRRRKYLPNVVARFCTQELKIQCAKRYLASIGWTNWTNALGIRADEQHRATRGQRERWERWFPLVDAGVTRRDVMDFWSRQPFDLQLSSTNGSAALGNCDGCFLKSEATLAGLARDYPERNAWWERMEELVRVELSKTGCGTWRKDYSRSELRQFVERQGDWIFETEGALCQADDGECTG